MLDRDLYENWRRVRPRIEALGVAEARRTLLLLRDVLSDVPECRIEIDGMLAPRPKPDAAVWHEVCEDVWRREATLGKQTLTLAVMACADGRCLWRVDRRVTRKPVPGEDSWGDVYEGTPERAMAWADAVAKQVLEESR